MALLARLLPETRTQKHLAHTEAAGATDGDSSGAASGVASRSLGGGTTALFALPLQLAVLWAQSCSREKCTLVSPATWLRTLYVLIAIAILLPAAAVAVALYRRRQHHHVRAGAPPLLGNAHAGSGYSGAGSGGSGAGGSVAGGRGGGHSAGGVEEEWRRDAVECIERAGTHRAGSYGPPRASLSGPPTSTVPSAHTAAPEVAAADDTAADNPSTPDGDTREQSYVNSHEPSHVCSHEPILHEPILHEPILHEPILHEPILHEPTRASNGANETQQGVGPFAMGPSVAVVLLLLLTITPSASIQVRG